MGISCGTGGKIGGRTEHLESLPDGLFEENMGGGIRVRTVLDALHVLPFGPERVTGALERRLTGTSRRRVRPTVRIIPASRSGMVRDEGMA